MSEEDLPKLRALYENGVKNGVKELEIVDAKRLHELEPNVSEKRRRCALGADRRALSARSI